MIADDVRTYLEAIAHKDRRVDTRRCVDLIAEETGVDPTLWGSIVGFGSFSYRYDSGRAGDNFRLGVAARSKNITVYISSGFGEYAAQGDPVAATKTNEILERLGKHTIGKGCLYIRRLDDVDEAVLRELVRHTWSSPGIGEVSG